MVASWRHSRHSAINRVLCGGCRHEIVHSRMVDSTTLPPCIRLYESIQRFNGRYCSSGYNCKRTNIPILLNIIYDHTFSSQEHFSSQKRIRSVQFPKYGRIICMLALKGTLTLSKPVKRIIKLKRSVLKTLLAMASGEHRSITETDICIS